MGNLTAIERLIINGMDSVVRVAAFALCFYAMYVAGIAEIRKSVV